MIEQEFKHSVQQWDTYRAFHTKSDNGAFVRFDTGEVIMASRHPFNSPDTRRGYEDVGVDLFYPSDAWAASHLFREFDIWDPHNERKVVKSWLPPSMDLLHDHHTHRVVSPGLRRGVTAGIPSRFENRAYIYWAGAYHQPLTPGTIPYYPFFDITLDEKRELREKLIGLKAQVRLLDGDLANKVYHRNALLSRQEFLAKPLSELTEIERHATRIHGFKDKRPTVTVPWLELKAKV